MKVQRGKLALVKAVGDFPIHGDLRWLTPDEGGRRSGYPATPPDEVFVSTAFVEPATAKEGLASILIDARDKHSWTTTARARWLIPEYAPEVEVGDTIALTDGPQTVAYLSIVQLDGI